MIFNNATSTLLCASLVLASVGCAAKDDDWVELFNGKDFSNFTQLGGTADYRIEDGAIVGTSKHDTPNSFLTTQKKYKDFILEWEFQVEKGLNSGVQFRSLSNPEDRNGRVHGYQYEMETSGRAWTGGVFDEARRGWLYRVDQNPAARAQAYNSEEWNKARIECYGNTIRTFLNGFPVSYVVDDPNIPQEGFIGLQVHSIGKNSGAEGKQVRWRKLRITENVEGKLTKDVSNIYIRNLEANDLSDGEAAQGWSLLFDGNEPTGFKSVKSDSFPEFGWEVKGEELVINARKEGAPRAGDIVTKKRYSAFELQLDFKLTKKANSGIKYFYSQYKNKADDKTKGLGLEFQILDDINHPDAKNGRDGNRTCGSLYDLIPRAAKVHHYKMEAKVGQWNHARIVAQPDGLIQHWLNGFKVVEYQRSSEEFRKRVAESKYKDTEAFGEAESGQLLLQDHNDEVSYRSIKVRAL